MAWAAVHGGKVVGLGDHLRPADVLEDLHALAGGDEVRLRVAGGEEGAQRVAGLLRHRQHGVGAAHAHLDGVAGGGGGAVGDGAGGVLAAAVGQPDGELGQARGGGAVDGEAARIRPAIAEFDHHAAEQAAERRLEGRVFQEQAGDAAHGESSRVEEAWRRLRMRSRSRQPSGKSISSQESLDGVGRPRKRLRRPRGAAAFRRTKGCGRRPPPGQRLEQELLPCRLRACLQASLNIVLKSLVLFGPDSDEAPWIITELSL